MKIEYYLEPSSEIMVSDYKSTTVKFNIEDAEVIFQIESQKLQNLKIVFKGLPIKYTENNIIDPYYPDVRMRAYKIFSYIANSIFIQTGKDVIEFQKILNSDNNINVFPETPEENEKWRMSGKCYKVSIDVHYLILGKVKLSGCRDKYQYAEAFSNFADGLRTKNLITKYIQFFKVVETFFNEKGKALDEKLIDYVSKLDSNFSLEQIQNLRIIRNRCMHPKHRKGHISSDNIELIYKLNEEIKILKKLARLLLENPPK